MMKIWKLTDDKYAIKEYLANGLFNKLVAEDGITYNQEAWRIEFSVDKLELIDEYFSEVEIMAGNDLLTRLYRINKFKPRKGLMRHAVMIYQLQDYIYFILKDQAFELLEEYEGILVEHDPKVKRYAEELLYLGQQEKLTKDHNSLEQLGIERIKEILKEEQGSFLSADFDSSPLFFVAKYSDLELTEEKRNKFFKQELGKRNVTAFNIRQLAEERQVDREVWFPIFEKLVEKEIKQRIGKLERLQDSLELEDLFSNQQALELVDQVEKLGQKLDRDLEELIGRELCQYYSQEKERLIYGI
ncbi:hypothetical protein MWH28_06175 [Natroniella sulfidigena]|uniref:hypothetical protein n=1 Tax=Natroniella sulfidigena TaxID=723921 RepID=UPI00200AE2FA|nr:hypothetical protein [Natroniella sulfidigena]MCK8816961.1 hypothetical protein [Natroniella sulfidigena]